MYPSVTTRHPYQSRFFLSLLLLNVVDKTIFHPIIVSTKFFPQVGLAYLQDTERFRVLSPILCIRLLHLLDDLKAIAIRSIMWAHATSRCRPSKDVLLGLQSAFVQNLDIARPFEVCFLSLMTEGCIWLYCMALR